MDGTSTTRMNRGQAYWLQLDLNAARRQLTSCYNELTSLRKENASLLAENAKLTRRIAGLTGQPSSPTPQIPSFVKPNTVARPRRKPGRSKGHEAALRPLPKKIDVKQDVPLPKDRRGKPRCPECHTQLAQLKHHRRIVEDIIPASGSRPAG